MLDVEMTIITLLRFHLCRARLCFVSRALGIFELLLLLSASFLILPLFGCSLFVTKEKIFV